MKKSFLEAIYIIFIITKLSFRFFVVIIFFIDIAKLNDLEVIS